MAVDTSPPAGGSRTEPLPLDPAKLTQAYRHSAAVTVPEVATGRRSPLAGHNMPPIERLPSKFAMRRDVQRLVRDEAECGRQRPPTPARPSLPQLDASMGASVWSTGACQRGCRSRSEPRTTGRENQDEIDQTADLLDVSVRSDGGGWRSVRARVSRDDSHAVASAGTTRPAAGVTLPPIGVSGKHTPVQRMTRQETQRLLAQAKINLQAMEAAKALPTAATSAVTSSGP
ncbi:uncharacterized protein LOC119104261 [Pollicipes pollicipes]|uniref:uncharacterized protein LOC119104261 n=1 Tax=Pollicipes pollicipes TaxID=41117 RepID=UPI001884E662|nr:uncharacterized protein LOC119104261 [Pollicipes pollicipes]